MKDKPTLDELFHSKKLDLPDDDFWNGFQDQVKGKTMAALSQQTQTAKVKKAGIYGIVPVLVMAMVGWSALQFQVGISTSSSVASLETQASGGLNVQNDLCIFCLNLSKTVKKLASFYVCNVIVM